MQDWNSDRSKSSREAETEVAKDTGEYEAETESAKDTGEYVGTDDLEESDELSDSNSDGLGDIWSQMTVALECTKVFSYYSFA